MITDNNVNCEIYCLMIERHHIINNENIVNFIAGLLGGFMSVTVCNPLDIARSRLNVLTAPSHQNNQNKYTHFSHALRTIWKEEGFKGFYAGYRTNVVAIPIFNSLFFPLFEYAKHQYARKGHSEAKTRLYATVTAGVICNIITNPIWVVRTRLMVQYLHQQNNQYKQTAPFQVIREMVEQEGVRSLFKGMVTSIFSVANAVIYFQCYQKLKEVVDGDLSLSVPSIAITSALSKVIASTLTYPIVVMRTVMYDFRGHEKTHFASAFRHIWKESGIRGFYAGLKPDLIRLIPSNAILFIVYEKSKIFLQ